MREKWCCLTSHQLQKQLHTLNAGWVRSTPEPPKVFKIKRQRRLFYTADVSMHKNKVSLSLPDSWILDASSRTRPVMWIKYKTLFPPSHKRQWCYVSRENICRHVQRSQEMWWNLLMHDEGKRPASEEPIIDLSQWMIIME